MYYRQPLSKWSVMDELQNFAQLLIEAIVSTYNIYGN